MLSARAPWPIGSDETAPRMMVSEGTFVLKLRPLINVSVL
jgi:hypothetical protein